MTIWERLFFLLSELTAQSHFYIVKVGFKIETKKNKLGVHWLILSACQPVKGYFMFRNKGIVSFFFYIFFCSCFFKSFFFYWSRDWTLTGTTTPDKSRPRSNGNSTHSRSSELEPHHLMQFCIIDRRPLLFFVGSYSSAEDTVSVF